MDNLSPAERSRRMSLVRGKDTRPEMIVRSFVHSLGYRFRLHDRKLPGAPDLVFASRRRVIFIHGCFWHQHSCAEGDRLPKSRIRFWQDKLQGNVIRDRRAVRKLRRAGWRVLVIWGCQLKDMERVGTRIARFLGGYRESD